MVNTTFDNVAIDSDDCNMEFYESTASFLLFRLLVLELVRRNIDWDESK